MTTEELKQYEPAGGWRNPERPLFAIPPVARGPEPGDSGLEAERQRILEIVERERWGGKS